MKKYEVAVVSLEGVWVVSIPKCDPDDPDSWHTEQLHTPADLHAMVKPDLVLGYLSGEGWQIRAIGKNVFYLQREIAFVPEPRAPDTEPPDVYPDPDPDPDPDNEPIGPGGPRSESIGPM